MKLSFGGATVEFGKLLTKGAEIIEQAPPQELTKPEPERAELALPERTETPKTDLPEQAKASVVNRRRLRKQRSALNRVLIGLGDVDDLARQLGDLHGIDAASAFRAMRMLVATDVVPESIGKLYETLSEARNVVAHSPTLPSPEEAMEYERQISYLKAALESARDAAKAVNRHTRRHG